MAKVMYCGCAGSPDHIKVKSGGKDKGLFTRLPIIRTAAAIFQDRRYGPGMRVFNPIKTPQGQQKMARCTVCTAVRGY